MSLLAAAHRRNASGSFTPASITGLKLWLAAAAITGLANDDPVATWSDISGQSNHATQATSGNRPTYKTSILNSLPVVRFDGTNDSLGFPLPSLSAATLFVVLSKNTTDDNKASCWSLAAANDPNSFWGYGGTVYDSFGTTVRKSFNPVVGLENVWRVYSATSAANAWAAYIDGTSRYSTGTNTFANKTSCILGANEFMWFLGDIAEVLIYDTALGTSNRQAVEDYLGAKYSLTITH